MIPTAAYAFPEIGTPLACQALGNGHINTTFLLTAQAGKFVLQTINTAVFTQPEALMENLVQVTDFIRTRGGNALSFLKTREGSALYRDGEGKCWRAYRFVDGLCLERATDPQMLYRCGLAFGGFQHQLSDYPAHTLHETIPHFHDTPHRFGQLKQAITADAQGRLESCRAEVDEALSHEEMGSRLMALYRSGALPLRVTHNDTKLNNVLLDPTTHQPLCVLDLDTVMPGLSACDFGDAIRSGAATAAEDEADPGKMHLDVSFYRAFARGFLEAAPSLTPAERQALPLGALTMTLECGIRFLTDYLKGDVYFKTAYPTHNLVRARTQLALCRSILQNWASLQL